MPDCDEKEFKGDETKEPVLTGEICPTGDELTSPPEEVQLPKIPDELREPVETPGVTEEELLTPEGLRVWNHRAVAVCNEEHGEKGEPVIIEDGMISQFVYFSSILSITDEVLDYIARHHLEGGIANSFHEGGLTVEGLVHLTGMTREQAETLLANLLEAQENLDRAAHVLAAARLKCCWENREQIADCPDDGVLENTEYKGAVTHAVVPAGEVTSCLSQDDADRKAKAQAEAMLVCIYGNAPFTARCEERPIRPADVMDPVPNDEEEIYPGRGLRVGVVEVARNSFFSAVSQEDADRKAQEWGYAQLICWYPNDAVELACDDPDARNEGVDPLKEEAAEANPETGSLGQHVLIPPGFYTSEVSREVATQQAELYAETLLRCCYISDEMVVECLPQEVIDRNGMKYMVDPNCEKGVCRSTAPRGLFTSCNSKEEANEFAKTYLEGTLDCVYCNTRVMPVCVPDWIIQGVADGKIDLPLTGPVITDGVNSIPIHRLPPEATIGEEANAICLPDAQKAQILAEASAIVPIVGNDDWCTCYSEEVIIGCAVEDPYGNNLPYTGGRAFKENGEPYNYFSLFPPETELSPQFSIPAPGEYLRFGAGIYSYNCFGVVGEERDGTDAGTMAVMEMAKAMLHCAVASPPGIGICDSHEKEDEWTPPENTVLVEMGGMRNRLTPWSHSIGNPVGIPCCIFHQEVKTEEEREKAVAEMAEEVRAMIISMIQCSYYNERKEDECIPPAAKTFGYGNGVAPSVSNSCTTNYRAANKVTIPSGAVIAESAEKADEQATALAEGLAVCDQDTTCSFSLFEGGIFSLPSSPPPTPPPTPPDKSPCKEISFEVDWYECTGIAALANGTPSISTDAKWLCSACVEKQYYTCIGSTPASCNVAWVPVYRPRSGRCGGVAFPLSCDNLIELEIRKMNYGCTLMCGDLPAYSCNSSLDICLKIPENCLCDQCECGDMLSNLFVSPICQYPVGLKVKLSTKRVQISYTDECYCHSGDTNKDGYISYGYIVRVDQISWVLENGSELLIPNSESEYEANFAISYDQSGGCYACDSSSAILSSDDFVFSLHSGSGYEVPIFCGGVVTVYVKAKKDSELIFRGTDPYTGKTVSTYFDGSCFDTVRASISIPDDCTVLPKASPYYLTVDTMLIYVPSQVVGGCDPGEFMCMDDPYRLDWEYWITGAFVIVITDIRVVDRSGTTVAIVPHEYFMQGSGFFDIHVIQEETTACQVFNANDYENKLNSYLHWDDDPILGRDGYNSGVGRPLKELGFITEHVIGTVTTPAPPGSGGAYDVWCEGTVRLSVRCVSESIYVYVDNRQVYLSDLGETLVEVSVPRCPLQGTQTEEDRLYFAQFAYSTPVLWDTFSDIGEAHGSVPFHSPPAPPSFPSKPLDDDWGGVPPGGGHAGGKSSSPASSPTPSPSPSPTPPQSSDPGDWTFSVSLDANCSYDQSSHFEFRFIRKIAKVYSAGKKKKEKDANDFEIVKVEGKDSKCHIMAPGEYTGEKNEHLCWAVEAGCEFVVTIKCIDPKDSLYTKELTETFSCPACKAASGCDYHECPQLEWSSCATKTTAIRAAQVKYDYLSKQVNEARGAYNERIDALQSRIQRIREKVLRLETLLMNKEDI